MRWLSKDAEVCERPLIMLVTGNLHINYSQLGLDYRLYLPAIHFNLAATFYVAGDPRGQDHLSKAQTLVESNTSSMFVLDSDDSERDENWKKIILGCFTPEDAFNYGTFDISLSVVYKPDERKLQNSSNVDYLGKSRVIASTSNTASEEEGASPFHGKNSLLHTMPVTRLSKLMQRPLFSSRDSAQPGSHLSKLSVNSRRTDSLGSPLSPSYDYSAQPGSLLSRSSLQERQTDSLGSPLSPSYDTAQPGSLLSRSSLNAGQPDLDQSPLPPSHDSDPIGGDSGYDFIFGDDDDDDHVDELLARDDRVDDTRKKSPRVASTSIDSYGTYNNLYESGRERDPDMSSKVQVPRRLPPDPPIRVRSLVSARSYQPDDVYRGRDNSSTAHRASDGAYPAGQIRSKAELQDTSNADLRLADLTSRLEGKLRALKTTMPSRR